jgi:hypothetical protein
MKMISITSAPSLAWPYAASGSRSTPSQTAAAVRAGYGHCEELARGQFHARALAATFATKWT